MPGDELRNLRKGIVVALVALLFSVTAYAFSSVVQKNWRSRLEKGEYRCADVPSSVFVIVVVEAATPPDVVISEPLQIIMATPDEVEEVVENTGEETEETEGDHNEETDPTS